MKRGKGYAVNVPMRDGIRDESFHSVFKPASGSAFPIVPVLTLSRSFSASLISIDPVRLSFRWGRIRSPVTNLAGLT
jgi:acetoin utilization deacetylase AcuC-like enzyme